MRILFSLCCLLISSVTQAASPLWTFTPLSYTTKFQIPPGDHSICAAYTITNQSPTTHNLELIPIAGAVQYTGATPGPDTGFLCPVNVNPVCQSITSLTYLQSCDLYITFSSTADTHSQSVYGGPIMCEQGNFLQCYQPNPSDLLSITILTA